MAVFVHIPWSAGNSDASTLLVILLVLLLGLYLGWCSLWDFWRALCSGWVSPCLQLSLPYGPSRRSFQPWKRAAGSKERGALGWKTPGFVHKEKGGAMGANWGWCELTWMCSKGGVQAPKHVQAFFLPRGCLSFVSSCSFAGNELLSADHE